MKRLCALLALFCFIFPSVDVGSKPDQWWKAPCVGCSDQTRFQLGLEGLIIESLAIHRLNETRSFFRIRESAKYQANEKTKKQYAWWQSIQQVGVSGGGAYVGPGDSTIQPGAVAWHGIRAYSLAKAGTKAINLCDNTGANCSDESTNASGNLVVGTHGVNNCATSDTCLVKIIYDQSGGTNCVGSLACDLTQTTTADMFILKHNCRSGTQFCLVGTSVTTYTVVLGGFISTLTQPFTATAVGRRTTFASAFTDLIGDNLAGVQIGFGNSSGTALAFAGTVTTAAMTEGNMAALNVVIPTNLNVNGASNTVSAGSSTVTIPCAGSCTNGGAIEFYEDGWWTGDQSSHFTALYGNQHIYWGF